MTARRGMALAVAAAVVPAGLVAAPAAASAAPPRTVTLTVADNGRHLHVRRGDTVLVRLRADPHANPDPTTWWRPIDETGRALHVRPQTAIGIIGITRAHYRAVRRGEATLASSRSVCPHDATGPTCHSLQGWTVTVDVR